MNSISAWGFYELLPMKKNIKCIFGPKQPKLTIRQSESNIERLYMLDRLCHFRNEI